MRRRREMMPGGETPTPRRGRISGREMLARQKTSAATLVREGAGFPNLGGVPRATSVWSHAQNFFPPFDFGLYNSMACEGKSNAMRGGERPGGGRPKRATKPRRGRKKKGAGSGGAFPPHYKL